MWSTQWWFCPLEQTQHHSVCYLCTLCICPWKLTQGEGRRKHYPESFVFIFSFILEATFWTGIYPLKEACFPCKLAFHLALHSPHEKTMGTPLNTSMQLSRSSTKHFMVSYENHLCPAVLWVNPFLPRGSHPCWQQEAAGPHGDSLVRTRSAPFTGDARFGLLWKLTEAKGKHTDNSKGQFSFSVPCKCHTVLSTAASSACVCKAQGIQATHYCQVGSRHVGLFRHCDAL